MTEEKRARQKANRASRVAEAEAAEHKTQVRSRMTMYGSLALMVVVAIVGFAVLNRDDDVAAPEPRPEPVCPAEDGSSPQTLNFTARQPNCIDLDASYVAVFDTSEGEVRVALDVEETPKTVNNFVTLTRWGYYDDTTLFRTDPTIDIIQGGAPHTESPSDPGPGYTIADEPVFDTSSGGLLGPYRYEPGQLVMARSSGPDSSSAQFFFTTGPLSAGLDTQGTYIIFGETDDDGLGVLKSIMDLHVDDPSSPLGGGPSRTVTINSVTIIQS